MKTERASADRIIENIAWESREHAVIRDAKSWKALQAVCDANEYVLDAAEVIDAPPIANHAYWNSVIWMVDRWLVERQAAR